MSSLLSPQGRIGRGAFAVRFVLIVAVTGGLSLAALYYVGKVWPKAYQLSQVAADADEAAKVAAAANAVVAAPATITAASASAAPASVASTPISKSAAPAMVATSAANATAAAAKPALPAGVSKAPPPHDERLDGFDRHGFANVSKFLAIVISTYGTGILLMQVLRRLRDIGWPRSWSVIIPVLGPLLATLCVFDWTALEDHTIWPDGIVFAIVGLPLAAFFLALILLPSRPGGDHDDTHAHAH